MSYKYGVINKRQAESPFLPSPTDSEDDGTPQTFNSEISVETPAEIPAEATVTTVITSEGITATITEVKSSIITTTVIDNATANNSDNSNISGSSNILVAALLGTIGLIIILSGLLIIIFWLRRGEKSKGGIINRGLTEINDNESINDEMVTYRPSDPEDEQLPSYAEAVVRGRNSTITIT
jgi:ATP-dependent Zn protease